MQIFTASVKQSDEEKAINDLKNCLLQKNLKEPNFLQFYFSSNMDPEKLRLACLKNFPKAKFSGACTQYGAFDDTNILGFAEKTVGHKHSFAVRGSIIDVNDSAVFVMAFYDEIASFGNAMCSFTNESDLNLSNVIRDSAVNAGRPGVMPNLIIVHSTQNSIGIFKKPFQAVLGLSTAVIGGLMEIADGDAKIFTQDKSMIGKSIYIMSFLYIQCDVTIENHSTSESTGFSAKITRVNGTVIEEMNNQPAADLFFRWLGVDCTEMSVEQMNALLEKFKVKYFVGKSENTITSDVKYNVSVLVSVSENRGLVTHYYWKLNDIVHLMKDDNNELNDSFMSRKLKHNRRVIAQLHIMCESFCFGDNAQYFKSFVVDRVRSRINNDRQFLVYSAAGEIGKDITDTFILGNYTVSTVTFMDTVEFVDNE